MKFYLANKWLNSILVAVSVVVFSTIARIRGCKIDFLVQNPLKRSAKLEEHWKMFLSTIICVGGGGEGSGNFEDRKVAPKTQSSFVF